VFEFSFAMFHLTMIDIWEDKFVYWNRMDVSDLSVFFPSIRHIVRVRGVKDDICRSMGFLVE
jgi:hypothetical protein